MLAAAVSCRTLVVEDDKAGCEVLVKALKLLGHEVQCATTVFKALRLLESFRPSHVLLDLMLPDGNGAEVIRYIREKQWPMRVAVITAAESPSRYWDEAVKYHPDALFKKPWNLNDLKAWMTRSDRL